MIKWLIFLLSAVFTAESRKNASFTRMTLHNTLLLVVGVFVVFTMGFLIGYMVRSVIAYKLFFSRLCRVLRQEAGIS